jgi:hypothetical protein
MSRSSIRSDGATVCAQILARPADLARSVMPSRTIAMRKLVLVLAMVIAGGALRGQNAAQKPQLQFSSSDQQLVRAFDWARKQALAYAFAGDPVGLWYEAALPGRDAFCMRDVSHQSAGAQALGLEDYTYNMLHHFAAAISASKDWCGYWEINRENKPAPVDYENNAAFWYNLPANFDVLDASYRMYLWSGDLRYIDDPVFDNFYDRTMNEYVKRWTLAPGSIMNRQRWLLPMTEEEIREQHGQSPYRRGIPGYDESENDYVAGIDLLAVEYAAFHDYAQIERLRGNIVGAQNAEATATKLRDLINNTWWDAKDNAFYALLNQDHHLEGSNTQAVLYWNAIERGPRMESAVKGLLASVQHLNPCAVEGESHDAEILYQYGAAKAAYGVLLDLTATGHCRQEYPEVSYSVIGAITTGLMGINMFPRRNLEVATLPALTPPTRWAELRNLPIGRNAVTVRHNGNQETVFTNQNGPALIWRAAFPGTFGQLLVNGQWVKAHNEMEKLSAISWVEVPVGAGDTVQVSTR